MPVRWKVTARNVIPQVSRALTDEVGAIVHEGLRHGEGVAKRNARVRTGFMRNNLRARSTGKLSGVLEGLANYTVFHEKGTRYMSARPMIAPGSQAAVQHMTRSWRRIERRLPRVR